MSYENTTSYTTRGTRLRIGSSDFPGVQTISGLGGGGATEIDITTLTSTAREYALGLPDEGSITIDGVVPLQHPVVATLEQSRKSGNELSCAIYIGGVPANSKGTDGSGVVTNEDVGASDTLQGGKNVWTTSANADTFNAIAPGDYVKYGSTTSKITKLETTSGNKLKVYTDASSSSTETEFDTIRPGIKLGFNGRVSAFERSASTDESWRYSLTLRITGSVTTTVGNPDVTIT